MNRKSKRYVMAKLLVSVLCLAIILVAVAALSPVHPTVYAKAAAPADPQTICATTQEGLCYWVAHYIKRCFYKWQYCDTYYNAIPAKTYCYPYSFGW